jgi:hypothetical protein
MLRRFSTMLATPDAITADKLAGDQQPRWIGKWDIRVRPPAHALAIGREGDFGICLRRTDDEAVVCLRPPAVPDTSIEWGVGIYHGHDRKTAPAEAVVGCQEMCRRVEKAVEGRHFSELWLARTFSTVSPFSERRQQPTRLAGNSSKRGRSPKAGIMCDRA